MFDTAPGAHGTNLRMTTLEDSLALTSAAPGEWRATASPLYEANTGMFGGWTAALLLKAVVEDERAQGAPISLNVNYLSRVEPKAELILRARLLGATRSLFTWQSELWLAATNELATTATVVLANRRESDTFLELKMPAAGDPETLGVFHPPATFGQRTPVRTVAGYPPFNKPSTHSVHWVRELSGRTVDHVQIAYLADVCPPRVFYLSEGPRPSSTVTLSVYFHASDAELGAVGSDYVLSEIIGTRATGSTCGSKLAMWSRQGALLATSEQLCWFK